MKRSPSSRRGRSSREADRLIQLAEGLARSGSRAEDRFWERQLETEISAQLHAGDEGALNVALDRLADSDSHAYEELADALEGCVEFAAAGQGQDRDVMLFAAPILAWSRVKLPARSIPTAQLDDLTAQLKAEIFATGARLSLTDYLWSPDQLPETFGETIELRVKLAAALERRAQLRIDVADLREAMPFLADVRYLVGAVSVEPGGAIFRWQETDVDRDKARDAWISKAKGSLEALFTACAFEPQLPGAYYVSCREADQAARPFSVRASTAFLSTTLNIEPAQLRVTIGACYDRRLEEFRLGFSVGENDEVIHGVVWPLLGAEDDAADTIEEIERVLRESGIEQLGLLDQRLPLEYCDDCGVPLYPNPEGELVHAELPEQMDLPSQHLH